MKARMEDVKAGTWFSHPDVIRYDFEVRAVDRDEGGWYAVGVVYGCFSASDEKIYLDWLIRNMDWVEDRR